MKSIRAAAGNLLGTLLLLAGVAWFLLPDATPATADESAGLSVTARVKDVSSLSVAPATVALPDGDPGDTKAPESPIILTVRHTAGNWSVKLTPGAAVLTGSHTENTIPIDAMKWGKNQTGLSPIVADGVWVFQNSGQTSSLSQNLFFSIAYPTTAVPDSYTGTLTLTLE